MIAPLRIAAFCAVAAVSGAVLATPPPIELVRHRGKGADYLPKTSMRPAPPWVAPPLKTLAAVGPTDVLAARYDIDFDPASGAVTAVIELDLAAVGGSVGGFGFYLDDGLTVLGASAPNTTVSHASQVYPPYRVVSFAFDPPLAAGSSLTLRVDYGGTANCTESSGTAQCSSGDEMPFMLETSIIPALIDAAGGGGYNMWGATRSLTLRVPSGLDVIATGTLADSTDDGTTLVTRWETPGYQGIGGYLAVMGDFTETPGASGSVPFGVHGLSNAPGWNAEMADWMTTILPFIDQSAGSPLPYAKLNVVKLPAGSKFPGTAGHAITLLSEDYAGSGARYFEETLAHENAHQWWGVLVSPTDTLLSRWLSEGLATLAQVDYTASRRIDPADRDAYLARRYREHRVLVRYHTPYESFPPLVVADPNLAPSQQLDYTIWAYIRSASILESFRAAIGDAAFASALAAYAQKCAMAACDTSDFREALEAASGEDFSAVFDGWVYASHHPRFAVTFQQQPSAEGYRVEVDFTDDYGIETPLELWLELETGGIERRKVRVAPGKLHHELSVPSRVRAVYPNPRHDSAVWSRSATTGDHDFDGEVDGFDLIRCARGIGRSSDFTGQAGEGILGIDLEFDPRCDVDENGMLDDQDLKPTLEAFGTLREDTP